MSHTYRFVDDITSYHYDQQRLDLRCGDAAVRIEVLAPDLLRLRLAPDGQFDHGFSYAVARDEWPATEVAFEAGEDALELRSAALTCRVQRTPCRISFYDPLGRLLAADADGLGWGEAVDGDRPVIWRQRLLPGAHFYGLGEKAFPMERRGRRFELYNTRPGLLRALRRPASTRASPSSWALVPVESTGSGGRSGGASGAYGVLFDNPARSFFDFGHSDGDVLSFAAEAGELRYYFMAAPKLTDVLESYVELTGRMALPPLWALGFHQARWSYPDEETVRELAAQFRQRRIPCDAVYLDIDYMDGYRCFTWNQRGLPQPPADDRRPAGRGHQDRGHHRRGRQGRSGLRRPRRRTGARRLPAQPRRHAVPRRRSGRATATSPTSPTRPCAAGGAISTPGCWRTASPASGTT